MGEIEEVKSSYTTGYDLEKGLIDLKMTNVWGAILPSEADGYHSYRLVMVRKALVDLIAHLTATLITFDYAKELPVETSADEVGARIQEILKRWAKESKERQDAKDRDSGEVRGESVPDDDGQEGTDREGGL